MKLTKNDRKKYLADMYDKLHEGKKVACKCSNLATYIERCEKLEAEHSTVGSIKATMLDIAIDHSSSGKCDISAVIQASVASLPPA